MKRHLALLGIVGSVVLISLCVAGRPGSQATGPQAAARDVVINEVAWSGTSFSYNDEWIELYNNTGAPIDLAGWTLRAIDGTPDINLNSTIPAHGYFMLERQDDCTISDMLADVIYSGALLDDGETLELRNETLALIDTANADGGDWPGGTKNPDHSMERIDPASPDTDGNWSTNDGVTRNGLDCGGLPLNATPRARNAAWIPPAADLSIDKHGPATILPGELITYTVTLSNAGQLPAQAVRLTDVLPAQVKFLTHTAAYTFSQPVTGTLVWDLGTVPTTTARVPLTFTVTGQVYSTAVGELTNVVTATGVTTDGNTTDNHDSVTTIVDGQPLTPIVLIDALYYDGYATYDYDEAFRLRNVSTGTANIGGWSVTNQTQKTKATFPPGTTLAPGQSAWCSRKATAFAQQFGRKPDFETDDTDADVPEMDGAWPPFANDGSQCLLQDADGQTVDVLVYEGGDPNVAGWSGPPVTPWSPSTYFGAQGQILFRKRDQVTGLPTPDTDAAADWAQDPADPIDGRKAVYPGWDLDRFFWTAQVTETAVLTISVGPDHLLDTLLAQIDRAEESIWLEGYTFESAALAHAITESLGAGVSVTLLLEGSPAGGMEPAQRWICGQIQDAGGQVYFMYSDVVHSRYRFQHAKFILIDDRLVLVGSENLNPTAMPADDKSDGTAGRRGVYLITDAPGVVERVREILAADVDPAHHQDLVTCADIPDLCAGSPPPPEPNWMTYTVAFTDPLTIRGDLAFEVIQSPENSLRTADSLLGLVGRAGPGDTVLVEQLYEYLHWGPGDGTPETDPNVRLEAYVEAARRGATVRILLNGFAFADYQNENEDAIAYLQATAREETLDLQARLGNPTYLGLHNKMVLAHVDNRGYVHVGSINGSEVSSKVNRELALQVQSDEAYAYLNMLFDHDWRTATPPLYLPLVFKNHQMTLPADHLLIGELFYEVAKEREWVEILNPTTNEVDLSAYQIGDAQRPGVFEGMYQFPSGTALGPRRALVIAASATTFQQQYGRAPDLEFYDTDSTVPDLIPSASWGLGEWHLRDDGDEVLLLHELNQTVDVVVYGDATYQGVIPHPGVSLFSHSLERYPPWFDTDDCSLDFRDWPFPNPGELPMER
jgi:cardiolipin synthase